MLNSRGFIQIPVLLAIVVSAAIFGGGGYYVSKTVHNSAPKPTESVSRITITASSTTDVGSSTAQINEEAENTAAQKPTTPTQSESLNQAAKANKVIDVCLNIEGVQSVTPIGYTVSSGICTLLEVNDQCPNIAGVQVTVPSGMSYVQKYNECLSESQIDAKVEAEYAAQTKSEFCVDAKERQHDLNIEIANIYAEYQIKLDEIDKNEEGLSRSGVAGRKSELLKQRKSEVAPLQTELDKANADVNYHCI